MNAVEVRHLSKYYKDVKAVDDISFTVKEGEFFAFLGVNGAGKSTTISVLCGKEQKTAGTVRLMGREIDAETRRSVGVVFQDSVLDRALTVRENLCCRAALYGLSGAKQTEAIGRLTDLFSLGGILKRPVGKLSGGQRRRVDIARALVHSPRLLILDEPTTGLDPRTRSDVWKIVHFLRKERGLTVFLTTHYMEEAAEADHVVIIDSGKIKADDSPLALKDRYAFDTITLYHVRELTLQNLSIPYEKVGEGLRIRVSDPAEATKLILTYPSLFQDYEIKKGGMDEVFLAVTGKRGGDR